MHLFDKKAGPVTDESISEKQICAGKHSCTRELHFRGKDYITKCEKSF